MLSKENQKNLRNLFAARKEHKDNGYGLNDKLPFGKYKDSTFELIISEDAFYIEWLLANTDIVLNNETYKEYQESLEEHRINNAEFHDTMDEIFGTPPWE